MATKKLKVTGAYRYKATRIEIPEWVREDKLDRFFNNSMANKIVIIRGDDGIPSDKEVESIIDAVENAIEYYINCGKTFTYSDAEEFFPNCNDYVQMAAKVVEFASRSNPYPFSDCDIEEIMNAYYDTHYYETRQIHGCVQRDWAVILFRSDKFDEYEIDLFESLFFNTGSYWKIYDYKTKDFDFEYYTLNDVVEDELSLYLAVPKEKIKIVND